MYFICLESLTKVLIHLVSDHRTYCCCYGCYVSRSIGSKNGIEVVQNNHFHDLIIFLPYPTVICNTSNEVSVLAVRCFLVEERSVSVAISDP